MKIVDVRTALFSYEYPAEARMVWPGGEIRSWDAALVEVTTDGGVTGVGEVAQGIMAAVAIPGVVQALKPYLLGLGECLPVRVGDALRSRTLFWSRGGLVSGVIGAIEAACFDAEGKQLGVPAYELLGGKRRERVSVYASGGIGPDNAAVLRWARRQEEAGFNLIKFRARPTAADTVRLLEDVVPQLQTGTNFIIDAVQGSANRHWTHENAIRVGKVAGERGAMWYEEPCRADDVGGYATVRAAVEVPVSGVESFSRVEDFENLVSVGGVDILQPDVGMVGGLKAFREVDEIADAHGLRCVPHVWGTAVAFMQNLHVVAASRTMELIELCTLPNPLRDALYIDLPGVMDGQIAIPASPGLGVRSIDELGNQFPFKSLGGHLIA